MKSDLIKVLEDCMNNICIKKKRKREILSNSQIDSKKEQDFERIIRTRRIRKYVINLMVCLTVLVLVSSMGTYALTGKTIWEVFFGGKGSDYAKELLDYNGQEYIIDDYTIKLEQSLYDRETNIGYCIFSITKKNGSPEAEINQWGQTPGRVFGEDGRFRIDYIGNQSVKFEFEGDTLYQYLSFRTDNEFDLKIPLIDEESGIDSKEKSYKFELKESSKYKEYKISEQTRVVISPLGLAIYTDESIKNVAIDFHYRNGKEESIVNQEKEIGIGNSGIREKEGRYQYQYVFDEIKAISDIEYIIYNGMKYN